MQQPATAMAVGDRAGTNVREVIGAFMRVRRVRQEDLGDALGLSQRQISRRLNVPGAISAEEMAAIAVVFGVSVDAFYKPVGEALAELFRTGGSELIAMENAKGVYVSSPAARAA